MSNVNKMTLKGVNKGVHLTHVFKVQSVAAIKQTNVTGYPIRRYTVTPALSKSGFVFTMDIPYRRNPRANWPYYNGTTHDDVIQWKHFLRYWPFVRGIYRCQVNSPHIGQWRGALMFSLICIWTNGWVNNREAGDLIRYRAHYDVIVMTV